MYSKLLGLLLDAPDTSPDRKIEIQYLVALSGRDRKMKCLNFAYWTLVVGVLLVAAQTSSLYADEFGLNLRNGDTWTLEATRRQLKTSGTQSEKSHRWTFRVAGEERIGNSVCWKINVSKSGATQTKLNLWCSQTSGMLLRLRCSIPARGGSRIVDEYYVAGNRDDGTGRSPVITPLQVLPCDFPVFPSAVDKGSKGDDENFSFSPVSAADRARTKSNASAKSVAPQSIGFSVPIRQRITNARPATTKSKRLSRLLDTLRQANLTSKGVDEAIDINTGDFRQVTLNAGTQTVEQYWRSGTPWPVIVDNGTTIARLISFQRGAAVPITNTPTPAQPAPTSFPNPRTVTDKSLSGPLTDSAEAGFQPWSGFWWPFQGGGLSAPLAKLDQVAATKAAQWELDNHVNTDPAAWHGHCHAWAAASVLEAEPTSSVSLNGQFSVGDQKGLITALHGDDSANTWGDRFGDPDADQSDIAPDEFWRLLQFHLGHHQVPLVADLEAGKEVWNYPIFRYRVLAKPKTEVRFTCELKIWFSSNDVDREFSGTDARTKTYHFEADIRDFNVVLGTGKWIGASKIDHPDFCWYPFEAQSDNPFVTAKALTEVLGYSVGEPAKDLGDPTQPVKITKPAVPLPPAHAPGSPIARPDEQVDSNSQALEANSLDVLLSPQETIGTATSRTSSWSFNIGVRRGDGGEYAQNESVRIDGLTEERGYLQLFMVKPDATISKVFPTNGQLFRVSPKKLFSVSKKDGLANITATPGPIHIFAVISERPWKSGLYQGTVATGIQQRGLMPTEQRELSNYVRQAQSKGSPEPVFSRALTVGRYAADSLLIVVRPAGKQKQSTNKK